MPNWLYKTAGHFCFEPSLFFFMAAECNEQLFANVGNDFLLFLYELIEISSGERNLGSEATA